MYIAGKIMDIIPGLFHVCLQDVGACKHWNVSFDSLQLHFSEKKMFGLCFHGMLVTDIDNMLVTDLFYIF